MRDRRIDISYAHFDRASLAGTALCKTDDGGVMQWCPHCRSNKGRRYEPAQLNVHRGALCTDSKATTTKLSRIGAV